MFSGVSFLPDEVVCLGVSRPHWWQRWRHRCEFCLGECPGRLSKAYYHKTHKTIHREADNSFESLVICACLGLEIINSMDLSVAGVSWAGGVGGACCALMSVSAG